MIGSVTWCWNYDDIASTSDGHALCERSKRTIFKTDKFRLPPFWPTVGQVAPKPASDAAGPFKLSLGHQEFAASKMNEPSGMIGVEMSEHHLAYIARRNSQWFLVEKSQFLHPDELRSERPAR